MPTIVSKGAYAIRCGKMPSAVSNWIARGKLHGPSLTPDGKIVVEEADRQLGDAIDPGRGAPHLPLRPPAPGHEEQDESMAATLGQLRIRKETLAVEQAERNAAIARGELVWVDEVTRKWGAALNDLMAAVELFVLDLPAKLGAGRDGVDLARREWREFRRRQADQAEAAEDAREEARAA